MRWETRPVVFRVAGSLRPDGRKRGTGARQTLRRYPHRHGQRRRYKDVRRPGEAIGVAGGMESPAFFVMTGRSLQPRRSRETNATIAIGSTAAGHRQNLNRYKFSPTQYRNAQEFSSDRRRDAQARFVSTTRQPADQYLEM